LPQAGRGLADLLIVPANDWRGVRVLGLADYFAPGDRTLTVQVPMGGIPTLYARTGDLFAWLCVAGLLVAVGIATIGAAAWCRPWCG
jgi:apolipoprotein N-acyltransferase